MLCYRLLTLVCCACLALAQGAGRLDHALELLRQGHAEQARAELEAIVNRDPADLQALAYLATAEIQAGKAELAITHARRLVEASPQDTDSHVVLAQAYSANADWAAAEKECRVVVERRPGSEGAHFELARVLLQLGRFDEGLAEVNRSLEINSGRTDARALKGNLLASMGKMEDAVREWNQVLAADANNPAALSGLAVYWKNSNPDFALDYARRAVELTNWQSIGSIRVLALVYRTLGNTARAREVLEKAVQKFPESAILATELNNLNRPPAASGTTPSPAADTPLGDVARYYREQKEKKAEQAPPAPVKKNP